MTSCIENIEGRAGGTVPLKRLIESDVFKYVFLASILFWGSEFAYHAWVDWAPTLLTDEYGY
ncbi:TPA: hypothetical protein EYP83_01265 [Candidatus Geothermarchaeota archaeon]|nr:hypothetical protein [Candidatus Geothermarchaeota archaeon]